MIRRGLPQTRTLRSNIKNSAISSYNFTDLSLSGLAFETNHFTSNNQSFLSLYFHYESILYILINFMFAIPGNLMVTFVCVISPFFVNPIIFSPLLSIHFFLLFLFVINYNPAMRCIPMSSCGNSNSKEMFF